MMIKKRSWDKLDPQPLWLAQNGLHADPLSDLRTKDNSISVWRIHTDRSNLDLVVTALAVSRDGLDKFEFGLFDRTLVAQLGIKINDTKPGKCAALPDANKWHSDLEELSVDTVVTLLQTIFPHIEKNIHLLPAVKKLVLAAQKQNLLEFQKINPRMRPDIEDLFNKNGIPIPK
jgi:hypothetical protein